jgi:hypothetical protein
MGTTVSTHPVSHLLAVSSFPDGLRVVAVVAWKAAETLFMIKRGLTRSAGRLQEAESARM